MATYIAFLRAVNVGGRTVRMEPLRDALSAAGLGEVETYIQTGNVRFDSRRRSAAAAEQDLEAALLAHCGFEVPAVLVTPAELSQVHADALGAPPLLSGDGLRRYVTFLRATPAPEAADRLAELDLPGERVVAIGRAVHWWLTKPTNEAKISNARLERLVGLGTTRDLKVVATLAERWGA